MQQIPRNSVSNNCIHAYICEIKIITTNLRFADILALKIASMSAFLYQKITPTDKKQEKIKYTTLFNYIY